MLYPSFADWWNSFHSSRAIASYVDQVANIDDAQYEELLDAAWDYNKSLLHRPNDYLLSDEQQETYKSLLDIGGNGIMGYIEIPVIDVMLPIYHGTSDATLEVGVGHLLGSSLPVGGASTHTVLTAHSGMASQKMFSDLNQLEKGDVFYLEVLDETLAYQVEEIHTVLPTNTDNLGITAGEERCTLVTCTPFGVNTHRLLVQGTRIPYEESEAIAAEQMQSKEVRSTWEEEYLNGIITGISVVILLAILVGTAMFFRRELE